MDYIQVKRGVLRRGGVGLGGAGWVPGKAVESVPSVAGRDRIGIKAAVCAAQTHTLPNGAEHAMLRR